MNYDRDKILDTLWTFKPHCVYMLLAIARSKENEEVRATDQPTMRKVVEDEAEIDQKIEQLSHATSRFDNDYRLYGTVNGRNTRDALHQLQKNSLDWIRRSNEGSEGHTDMMKRVDHEWKSILHRPPQRDQNRFLWDVDDPSNGAFKAMERLLEGVTIISQSTPNGYHFVTAPFNYTDLDTDGIEVERKTDDMIYLGFL
jgi:hypothetical protein